MARTASTASSGHDRDERRRATFARSRALLLDRAEKLLSLLADHDEDGADRRDRAFLDEDLQHGSRPRGRDLDRRLVGLHLDERLILVDRLPLRDEPARDLGLGEALAEVGQLELVGHGGGGY